MSGQEDRLAVLVRVDWKRFREWLFWLLVVVLALGAVAALLLALVLQLPWNQ